MAAVASGLFFLIAPGTVAGYLPWSITRWHIASTGPWPLSLKVCGALLLLAGVAVLADSFVRFAVKGLGTPAPPLPTRHLRRQRTLSIRPKPDVCRSTRSTIFGQALIFGNLTLVSYGAFVCLCFHLFVIAYEEPSLRDRFGNQYTDFCAAVPRWIPRLSPWRG